ncbi:hypothetical protein BB431_07775 [Helicobacter pylori]|nr:hypothetical protein BB431_07775 [Helicobacter pylori]
MLFVTHHEKRKQYNISQSYQQEPKVEIAPSTENNVKENNAKEPNNNEMNMEQFNKMLEMAQNNPQMLAMLQQTLNKGAEQQKHDNYFANDEAAPTQSKGRGR